MAECRPAPGSLAFQADVQHDDPQFPDIGAARRHGLIQLEIHAQRISREQARRDLADVDILAGRGVGLGGKRAASARAARGSLYYQAGKPESAVGDLELVASRQPDDAVNLDRLGQTYQALDRMADAVRVLRRAAELAPEDSKTLLHFARALADAGQTEESKVVMDRFRQLGPEQKKSVPAGLVEYLSLTPAQRHADYRARVEKAVRDHPEDPDAQVAYLKLLIEDGNARQAATAAKRVASLQPAAAVLADAGRALAMTSSPATLARPLSGLSRVE